MLLVHISDLHCGPRLRKDILSQAIQEINDLNPDAVVVTGDLTEEGLAPQFRQAKSYLDQLHCEHLLVSSGNHDSRTTGYILFPRFFGEPSSVTKIDDTLILMLNSSRPDREKGEIGYNQGLWMKETLNDYQENEETFKIIALHHHLIPVPDTGMERNTVCDAGDLLQTLTSGSTDLVLTGHRHRPWIWSLGNLQLINAGALSTDRLRGFYQNTYNILNIRNCQLKEAYLKVPGGKKYELTRKMIESAKEEAIKTVTSPFPT